MAAAKAAIAARVKGLQDEVQAVHAAGEQLRAQVKARDALISKLQDQLLEATLTHGVVGTADGSGRPSPGTSSSLGTTAYGQAAFAGAGSGLRLELGECQLALRSAQDDKARLQAEVQRLQAAMQAKERSAAMLEAELQASEAVMVQAEAMLSRVFRDKLLLEPMVRNMLGSPGSSEVRQSLEELLGKLAGAEPMTTTSAAAGGHQAQDQGHGVGLGSRQGSGLGSRQGSGLGQPVSPRGQPLGSPLQRAGSGVGALHATSPLHRLAGTSGIGLVTGSLASTSTTPRAPGSVAASVSTEAGHMEEADALVRRLSAMTEALAAYASVDRTG